MQEDLKKYDITATFYVQWILGDLRKKNIEIFIFLLKTL